MPKHAILGASSAKRWINCPGSIRLIAALPKAQRDNSSKYADEGSAAHGLCEHCILNGVDPEALEGWVMVNDPETDDWTPKTAAEVGDYSFPVTDEMVEAARIYIDEIARQMSELPGGSLRVEATVQPLDREDMFGTTDAVVSDELLGELVVTDFKYGKGVVVEVEHNEQAMVYGLGALREAGAENFSKVTLVIVQPRAFHEDGPVRSWPITAQELIEWGETISAAADRTSDPEAPLNEGDWCQFCPALATCPAVQEKVLSTAKMEFSPVPIEPDSVDLVLPDPNDPEQIAMALNVTDLMDKWTAAVRSMAHHLAESGTKIPGHKLVRGRAGNRAWMDSAKVEKILRGKRGVTVEMIYDKKLRSPTQLEKEKSIGKEWVKKRVHQPEGKLKLVPESDKRKEVSPPAIEDFAGKDIPEDDTDIFGD